MEEHVGRPGVGLEHGVQHGARIAELLLPHERGGLDEAGVDVPLVDGENGFGGLQGGVELGAAQLQLGQRQTCRNVIRLNFDGLLELLARLFEFTTRGVRAAQVKTRNRVHGVAGYDRLQFGQRPGDVAFVEQEGGRESASIVIVGTFFEDRRIDFGGFAALALPHQHFDHALLVGGLLFRVLGHAFLVLANGRIAVAHAQVEIADRQVRLVEILGMTLDLVEDVDHVVAALLPVVMHGEEGEECELFGIVSERLT